MGADHRATPGSLDGVQRRPLARVPAHVEEHAEPPDLVDQGAPITGQADLRLQAAAAVPVGRVVGDPHDPEPQVVVRGEGAVLDVDRIRGLPAVDEGDGAVPVGGLDPADGHGRPEDIG